MYVCMHAIVKLIRLTPLLIIASRQQTWATNRPPQMWPCSTAGVHLDSEECCALHTTRSEPDRPQTNKANKKVTLIVCVFIRILLTPPSFLEGV